METRAQTMAVHAAQKHAHVEKHPASPACHCANVHGHDTPHGRINTHLTSSAVGAAPTVGTAMGDTDCGTTVDCGKQQENTRDTHPHTRQSRHGYTQRSHSYNDPCPIALFPQVTACTRAMQEWSVPWYLSVLLQLSHREQMPGGCIV